MTKISPAMPECIIGHDIEEKELLSVIISGEFKTVVFCKLDGKYYIIIGDTTAYNASCYWNNCSVSGYALIEGTGDWYETTENESEAVYRQIMSTRKISTKNGRPYYRYNG